MADDAPLILESEELGCITHSQLEARLSGSRVSVASFGVTGIGDDTDCMINAINWQLCQRQTYNPEIGSAYGSAVMTVPALTIPGGWRISVTGELPIPAYLVSEGRSSIESLDPTKDIFSGDDCYMTYFADINFIGGKTQTRLQNNNINAGMWLFDRCTFEGSNDYAVRVMNTSTTYGVTSTQLIMNDCRWIRDKLGLYTNCDHSYINGGWAQIAGDFFNTNTAFIYNKGLISISQFMFIPGGLLPPKSRWIDNWGACRFNQVRFGGEGGGIPNVYHFAKPTRYLMGTAESIEMGISYNQCTAYGGNASRPDRGLIVIQGNIPTIVRLTDSSGPINGPIMSNDPNSGGIPNIPAYLTALKNSWNGDDLYAEISYHNRGGKVKSNSSTQLWPEDLQTFVYSDNGRLVKQQVKIKNSVPITVPTNTLSKLSLTTAVYDPYSMKSYAAGLGIIKTPENSRYVEFTGYVEVASHSANNLIYNLRVYAGGAPIEDAYVNYQHCVSGQIRIQISGSSSVVAGSDLDLRFLQNSGSLQTVVTASLSAQFF